jgi:hypothetical protein
VSAVVVRWAVVRGVLDAFDERVKWHALQPNRGDEHQGEGLDPSRQPICAGGNRHGEAVVLLIGSALHRNEAK